MDLLQMLMPFLMFFIGVWLTPYIENRKDKGKAKKTYNNFLLELNDELEDVPKKLKKMADSMAGLKAIKNDNPKTGQLGKYVPRNMMFYFTKATVENSFRLLSKEQRDAIKSFSVQVDELNSYMSKVRDESPSDDTLDMFIDNCKRYLFTGVSMINTMRIIAKNPSANMSGNDNEIVNAILKELNIELSVDDLKIKQIKKFK